VHVYLEFPILLLLDVQYGMKSGIVVSSVSKLKSSLNSRSLHSHEILPLLHHVLLPNLAVMEERRFQKGIRLLMILCLKVSRLDNGRRKRRDHDILNIRGLV
jgi:hypothetical protein